MKRVISGRKIGVTLDWRLYAEVMREADGEGLSLSAMVNKLCAEAIAARIQVREWIGRGKEK